MDECVHGDRIEKKTQLNCFSISICIYRCMQRCITYFNVYLQVHSLTYVHHGKFTLISYVQGAVVVILRITPFSREGKKTFRYFFSFPFFSLPLKKQTTRNARKSTESDFLDTQVSSLYSLRICITYTYTCMYTRAVACCNGIYYSLITGSYDIARAS